MPSSLPLFFFFEGKKILWRRCFVGGVRFAGCDKEGERDNGVTGDIKRQMDGERGSERGREGGREGAR